MLLFEHSLWQHTLLCLPFSQGGKHNVDSDSLIFFSLVQERKDFSALFKQYCNLYCCRLIQHHI